MKKHTESLGELRGLRRLLLLYCPALMYHASATSIGQRLVGINGCRHRSLVHHFAEKGLRMRGVCVGGEEVRVHEREREGGRERGEERERESIAHQFHARN